MPPGVTWWCSPARHRGKHSDFVGVCHRRVVLGGIAVAPNPAVLHNTFELAAIFGNCRFDDLPDGAAAELGRRSTRGLASLSEQSKLGHRDKASEYLRYP